MLHRTATRPRLLSALLLAVALPLALSACAGPRAADTANTGTPASETAAPTQAAPMPAADCNPEAAKAAIGKTADAATIESVRASAGGHTVRVLKPGQMITKEYLQGRVNVHVDEKNVIVEIGCG